MIHTCIPFCPPEKGKNLGFAYNSFMNLIRDDDWACFLDHDAMFTTDDWYQQLQSYTKMENRKIGLLTAVTNRIGNQEQRFFQNDSIESLDHDFYFHRKIGRRVFLTNGLNIKEARSPVSGVLLLISKKTWRSVGGFCDGFLGVDNDIDKKVRKVGLKVYIAEGLYVYHWYRASQGTLLPIGYNKGNLLPSI